MDEKTVQLNLLGQAFVCTVCAHDEFRRRRVELKTPGSSFLKTKENAIVLVCSKCGYVHWFMPELGSFEAQTEPEV